jgi:hypothetical protein
MIKVIDNMVKFKEWMIKIFDFVQTGWPTGFANLTCRLFDEFE